MGRKEPNTDVATVETEIEVYPRRIRETEEEKTGNIPVNSNLSPGWTY